MPINYAYPTPVELREIERTLLPALTIDDDIFKMFPITEVNSWRLKWRQRDNFQGLQQVRGLGGAFKVVENTGMTEYDFEPGVYGEFSLIEENELTEHSAVDSLEEFIPINDIVGDRQSQLLVRRLDRIRFILWTLLGTGVYSVADRTGAVKHVGTFPFQTASAAVAWSTAATSTPYADLAAIPLKARGQSVSFGRGKAYMNRKQFNRLAFNTNAADIFGRRTAVGATFNSQGDVNKLFADTYDGDREIPEIVIYDRGYISDGTDGNTKGTFIPFIPDGVVIIVGDRANGAALGEYRLTRNANNANSEAGPYTRIRDLREFKSPPALELEDAHSGGPIIWFPGAVVILSA